MTGPDEYTTVVNDNLFTNVMARFNLAPAVAAVVERLASDPAGRTTRLVAPRSTSPRTRSTEWLPLRRGA